MVGPSGNAVVNAPHETGDRAAFLSGSVITEGRTAASDLEIVILLHGAPVPYRLSVQEHGWPVELLVLTEESWHGFIDREVATRKRTLMWICAEGILLFDRPREVTGRRRIPARARLHGGVRLALQGRAAPLVAAVDEVLDQAGGRLRPGYRRSSTP